MPVYRRRPARQIAKVNAKSIDGYFGEGTPCFFIRGTILSDVQVDGEYRTLAIARPGNLIEIESFDGDWATIVITTRAGNRVGDNLRARLMLRDSDLRSVGVDCERILAGLGSFEQPEEPQPAPEPPPVAAPTAVEVPAAFAPWTEATDAARNGSNGVHGSNGSSNGVAHVAAPPPAPEPAPPEPVAAQTVIDRVEAAEPARTSSLFGGRTSVVDGKVLIELGASVVAVALPVVLFFLRSLFAKKDDR
jgi:hypothetical protein